MAEFKLVKADHIPSRVRSSLYNDILTEFQASKMDLAQVVMEDKKPLTILQGLTKAKKDGGTKFKDVEVKKRGEQVYLTK